MIEIICNNERYVYNIYHITKAFFPAEEVVVNVDAEADQSILMSLPDGSRKKLLRAENKKESDRFVYETCEAYTGRTLAWGMLTGVRPVKLAMQRMEEGMSKEKILAWFGQESFVSEEKSKLAYDIACREREILKPLDYKNGYSLYVGIPFCPSVCSYCSFSSGSIKEWGDYVEDYLTALCRELSYIGEVSKEKKLNSIYIGGGTPTTLSETQLEKLLSHIDRTFSREHLLEYTVEAGRPDSITPEKLEVIRNHKVTRISVNPQTMQQKTLDLVGRNHTVEDVRTVFYQARALGFTNINMDLIAGLPGETAADMADTLKQIKELSPDSLTVHALAIKRAARMGQNHEMQRFGKELTEMIQGAAQAAEDMGLLPYYLYRQKNIAGNFENVGYAKVDKAGIYNILIMEEKQSIVATGAGATTKVMLDEPVAAPGSKRGRRTNLIRIENVKDIREYISRIDEMIERKGEWLWR